MKNRTPEEWAEHFRDARYDKPRNRRICPNCGYILGYEVDETDDDSFYCARCNVIWCRYELDEAYYKHRSKEELIRYITTAMEIIGKYGSIDGAYHPKWVLDQVVRALCGDGYAQWSMGITGAMIEILAATNMHGDDVTPTTPTTATTEECLEFALHMLREVYVNTDIQVLRTHQLLWIVETVHNIVEQAIEIIEGQCNDER